MTMTAVVLAGGRSRRLQTDKAFLNIGGKRLIERVLDVVTPLFTHIFINSNQPALYQEWNVPVIPDKLSNKGALGGIYTALHAAPTTHVLCVACDMPFLNPDLLQAMMVRSNAYDALVPRLPDGLHPLHAIYSKRCLRSIETLLRQNRLKISGFFPLVKTHYFNVEDIRPFDPHFESFINLNTWEEVERAHRKLERKQPSKHFFC